MIRIAIVGDIGSGKSYLAKLLGFPVFNADLEVIKIYNKNRKCFLKLNKKLPKFIKSFPIKKEEIANSIISNGKNLKKITKIVHPIIKSKMFNGLSKIDQHKLVYKSLKGKMGNELHALSITTEGK